jgi:adenylylsulfate kinase-like enzyme
LNIRRVAEAAKLMMDEVLFVICQPRTATLLHSRIVQPGMSGAVEID